MRLWQEGIRGHAWRCLRDGGSHLVNYVYYGGTKSKAYEVSNGLREGSSLSPLLFLCFINPFIEGLKQRGLGACLRGPDGISRWVGALCFADDIALTADNPQQLQAMLDYLTEFCEQWRLLPSPTKSEVVVFRRRVSGRTKPHVAPRPDSGEPGPLAVGHSVTALRPVPCRMLQDRWVGSVFTDRAGSRSTVTRSALAPDLPGGVAFRHLLDLVVLPGQLLDLP